MAKKDFARFPFLANVSDDNLHVVFSNPVTPETSPTNCTTTTPNKEAK